MEKITDIIQNYKNTKIVSGAGSYRKAIYSDMWDIAKKEVDSLPSELQLNVYLKNSEFSYSKEYVGDKTKYTINLKPNLSLVIYELDGEITLAYYLLINKEENVVYQRIIVEQKKDKKSKIKNMFVSK